MRRGLLLSLIAIAAFVLTSAAGANVGSLLKGSDEREGRSLRKSGAARQSAATIDARTYRSPGHLRKVLIAASDAQAISKARAAGATEISDYESFKLFLMTEGSLESGKSDYETQSSASAHEARPLSAYQVRDDFNVIMLRSGVIDTTASDAPGRFSGLGGVNGSDVAQVENSKPSGLRLVQFVGPVKQAWLEQLKASGFDPIAYVPNNAYLVRGPSSASAQLARHAAISGGDGFLQWEAPFIDEYKIHPALARLMNEQPGEQVTVAIQVARSRSDIKVGDDDVKAARRLATSVIGDAYMVLGFTNLRMTVDAGRIAALAALPNVINVEPWTAPEMFDERSAQIIAGDLTGDGKAPRGPGYIAWLAAHGFTSNFNFAIDLSDSGLDRGVKTPDKLHPDFLDANKQSRVIYVRDYTSELDPGDIGGHGTINLSIAGGGSVASDKGSRDSSGYNYGLGIAPFAMLGSSKIFQSSGRFDLIEPFTTLISQAYSDGARVSSNSWGELSNSYTLDAQEYDARVRDAVPGQAGNQEMSISFAAGNAGVPSRIGAPSSAKNVISVAASESSRKDGTDGCNVKDENSDSALDMAFFSSRGPLDDGRLKPDITAPGTHVEGAASQHAEFDGSGVCGLEPGKNYFPDGQTLYTWSSGTSHSTPQVAGAAALARQFFLNRGEEPSAALIKALLLNTTTYMTGEGAKGDLPHPAQGWGLLNLNRAFDNTPKIFVNQSNTFNTSGQESVFTGEIKDATQPFRVMLAWTDAPGFSAAAPWVNDLDLEVVVNGQVYRGNNFEGQESQPGGEPNTRDNTEAVWLPAGTIGTFVVRVRATNIAGDGVPGNADFTDQDFALVVYNGERKDVPVVGISALTLTGRGDAFADPGESVEVKFRLVNLSPVTLTAGQARVSTPATGQVSMTVSTTQFPAIAPGQTGDSDAPIVFSTNSNVPCGTVIKFFLDISSQGVTLRVPFTVMLGKAQAVELFSDDVESGEAKWAHGSGAKKKKNRIDTWTISTKRFHSGGSSWFSTAPGKLVDTHLDTVPLLLPADGRNLRLVFYHT
ncbi:MAG TPA: S8 family serine peptidase, partial [Blastocatellia bacterium]